MCGRNRCADGSLAAPIRTSTTTENYVALADGGKIRRSRELPQAHFFQSRALYVPRHRDEGVGRRRIGARDALARLLLTTIKE